MLIVRWIIALGIAFALGKAVSKLKLPSLLGWLIGGMLLGPYALGLMSNDLVLNHWYEVILKILECAVGFMIGTELVYSKLKKSGKALVITTLFQSVGTYIVVSAIFFIIFKFMGIPTYIEFIFGEIALATAPAPALSILQEFKTSGPVTDILIPMEALDDVVGVVMFFSKIALLVMQISGGSVPLIIVPIMIVLPLIIGAVMGFSAGILLKKFKTKDAILVILISFILLTSFIGFMCNEHLLTAPVLNFMLMGMSFSAVFANMLDKDDLENVIENFEPVLGVSLLVVIVNLGIPLDYKTILGSGVFTLVYIVSRAIGKYFGASTGAKLTKMPETVQKYLGFTLLPHSGVLLVFAGIAVSVLSKFGSEHIAIVQGTVAAVAIINEIIALFVMMN